MRALTVTDATVCTVPTPARRIGTLSWVARVVVAANGLGGRLHAHEGEGPSNIQPGSRIGAGALAETAPTFFQDGTIYMACGEGGYVGLVRLEDGRLDIAAAFDTALIKASQGLGKAAELISKLKKR